MENCIRKIKSIIKCIDMMIHIKISEKDYILLIDGKKSTFLKNRQCGTKIWISRLSCIETFKINSFNDLVS